MNFLVYLTIVLAVIAIARLVRIFELASELRGEKQYVVNERDTRFNANSMLVLVAFIIGFFIWQIKKYSPLLLPVAASVEGAETDWLLNLNFAIITIVFIICNILLFFFAYKYAYDKNRKATFFPESHKLELIWTIIPGVALAFIIFFGLKTWNSITAEPEDKFMVVELYPKQFDWTSRYSGDDNELGYASYLKIDDTNPLGVDSTSKASWDDFIVRDTIVIPVNKRIKFAFRSRDVIHSAYLPHFRMQMNCVPGMITQMHFVPTITTDSMRAITKNPEFNYLLLCNKICGASHYNMQLPVKVVKQDEFDAWYESRKSGVIFPGKKAISQNNKKSESITPVVNNESSDVVMDSTSSDTTAK